MKLSKLYIHNKVADYSEVINLKAHLGTPFQIFDNLQTVLRSISNAKDPIKEGKRSLILTENKGAFIKKCPGTRHYTCCGYKIMHIGSFCNMDCSYCILQTYFHPPVLQYFVNQMDLMNELDTLFLSKNITRIGTGEFSDSLIWEQVSDLNCTLVKKFSKQAQAILELKSKATTINNLKSLKHNRKTVLAWSVNTETVVKTEERQTSPLSARLKAAAKCESWGYPVAFHFDPMVIYDGCENDYLEVVDEIFNHVSKENIIWISLGAFRYMPTLKPIIQNRFPDSKIVYGEFITGIDGKMRYFKPLRIDLFHRIYMRIKEIAPDMLVYLCMEDEEVWQKAMGFSPSMYGGLSHMLDQRACKICKLDRS